MKFSIGTLLDRAIVALSGLTRLFQFDFTGCQTRPDNRCQRIWSASLQSLDGRAL